MLYKRYNIKYYLVKEKRSLKLYSYSWNWIHRTLKWWYPYHFIYQFPGSNEKSQRHQVSRGFRKRDTAERGDHPCPRTEFGVHVHGLSIVARVGTKLLDVLETGHRIFLYLICKVDQKNNPRRLARHTILLSSFFLFHVFDMLACCFHSLGDLKLPGRIRPKVCSREIRGHTFSRHEGKFSENETEKTMGKTKEAGSSNIET